MAFLDFRQAFCSVLDTKPNVFTMKKILLSLGLTTAIFGAAQAQQFISLGPVIGFGHSGVTNGNLEDATASTIKSKFNPSFNAGIGLIYAKHAHWGFGGEILYSQEGLKKQLTADPMDIDLTKTAGYIRVPLRAYYFFGKYQQKIRPKVYLGPSFGFKISDKEKFEGNNEISRELLAGGDNTSGMDFKTFDLGIQAGVGVNITLAKAMWLNLDLNYTQGVLDALENNDDADPDFDSGSNLNQNLRLQVGVLFGLGKVAKEVK